MHRSFAHHSGRMIQALVVLSLLSVVTLSWESASAYGHRGRQHHRTTNNPTANTPSPDSTTTTTSPTPTTTTSPAPTTTTSTTSTTTTDPTTTTTTSTTTTTAPPSSCTDPSGQPMPVGDIAGYKQVFADDFDYTVPLGSFPSAVSSTWNAYPDGWSDTSGNGEYYPSDVVSIGCGVMNIDLHTQNGIHMVAAPVPIIPGATGSEGGLSAGMYEVRFRATVATPYYKTAFLLWPDSENWPQDGEIDFPEGDLDSTINAYMHYQGATSGSQQDAYSTSATYTAWHTATIVWRPDLGYTKFYMDGTLVGDSTANVPDTPMHWVLQCETDLGGQVPPASVSSDIQLAWVTVYEPT